MIFVPDPSHIQHRSIEKEREPTIGRMSRSMQLLAFDRYNTSLVCCSGQIPSESSAINLPSSGQESAQTRPVISDPIITRGPCSKFSSHYTCLGSILLACPYVLLPFPPYVHRSFFFPSTPCDARDGMMSITQAVAHNMARHQELTEAIAQVEHAPAALVKQGEAIETLNTQLRECAAKITEMFERTQRERRALEAKPQKKFSLFRFGGSTSTPAPEKSPAFVVHVYLYFITLRLS
jgi:hypothetical protein